MDTLDALKLAASSESDRRLIDAAAFANLGHKELNILSRGNANRARRGTERTTRLAYEVVAIHRAYRKLAIKDALSEASLLLGGDALTESDIARELQVLEEEDASVMKKLIQDERGEPLISIDDLEGSILANETNISMELLNDDESVAAECLKLTAELDSSTSGPLTSENKEARKVLGSNWYGDVCDAVDIRSSGGDFDDGADDPYVSSDDSGSVTDDESSTDGETEAIDVTSLLASVGNDKRRVVAQIFAKVRRKRLREADKHTRRVVILGRKRGYTRSCSILNRYPHAAKVLQEVIEELHVGADAWRRTDAYILNTAIKRTHGSGVSGLRRALAKRGIHLSRVSVRRLGVAVRIRSMAASRYYGAVKYRLKRNVKRLAVQHVDSKAMLSVMRSDTYVRSLASGKNIQWFSRDDMASQAFNSAAQNAPRQPTLEGDEIQVPKHSFVSTSIGTSLQATTYYFPSLGSGPDASAEANVMFVKANSLSPSDPAQHAADDHKLRRVFGGLHEEGSNIAASSSVLFDSDNKLKINLVRDVDNGSNECVRRAVVRFHLAEQMCGGPLLVPEERLASAQLASIAPNDTDKKKVERLNACGKEAVGSFTWDCAVYEEKIECLSDPVTGEVDPIRLKAMHLSAAEHYRALLDDAPGLNGCRIIAFSAATAESGPAEKIILERAKMLEELCSSSLSSRRLRAITESHPELVAHYHFVKERMNHWQTDGHYKYSLNLCDNSKCVLCSGHPRPGNWGGPGSPPVTSLPDFTPDPTRLGHYMHPEQALAAHLVRLKTKQPAPQPPSIVLTNAFRRLRQGVSITSPILPRHVEMAVREVCDESCTFPVVNRLFDKLRFIQMRRAAGALKAANTRRLRLLQPSVVVPVPKAPQPNEELSSDNDDDQPHNKELSSDSDDESSGEDGRESNHEADDDASSESEEIEKNQYKKPLGRSFSSASSARQASSGRRGIVFTDSSLIVGEMVGVAWPDDSVYTGTVMGRPAKKQTVHVLQSSRDDTAPEHEFPTDHSCARTISFEDGETLHLSLPDEREVTSPGTSPKYGFWRRLEDRTSNGNGNGKKRHSAGSTSARPLSSYFKTVPNPNKP